MSELKIVPLGGLGEVGGNLLYIEYLSEAFVFDAGLLFPPSDMYGVDYIIPDYRFLLDNKDKIKAFIFSHGHEDHIGAAVYILPQLNKVPIYGGKLTIEFLKAKFQEFDLDFYDYEFIEIESGKEYKVSKNLYITFLKTIHSIADSYALALKTKWGYIINSSDFKLDSMYMNNLDLKTLSRFQKEGVFILMSDSTYADVKGYSLSEKEVLKSFYEIFSHLQGRFIFSTFSSSFYRIKNIINTALDFNKKIVFSGYSMLKNISIYRDLRYLNIPSESVVDITDIYNYNNDELVILATGSQGEPNSALSLISSDMHRFLKVEKSDIYIISASPIPGNEENVIKNINKLMKKGAEVIYNFRKSASYDYIVHATGHGYQEELKILINLVKPKYFIPVHGEYRHLLAHRKLAVSCGIKEENVFVLQDGDILEFKENKLVKTKSLELKQILVENGSVYNYDLQIQKERQILSSNGIIAVIYMYQIYEGIVSLIDVVVSTKGFFYDLDLSEKIKFMLLENSKYIHERVNIKDKEVFRNYIKNRIRKFIKKLIKTQPLVIVNLIDFK